MIEFYSYTDVMKLTIEAEQIVKEMLWIKDWAIYLKSRNKPQKAFMRFSVSGHGECHSNILYSSRCLVDMCLNNFEKTSISSVSHPEYYNDAVDLTSDYPIIWYPIYKQSKFKIIGVLEIASPRLLIFNHAAMLEIEDSQTIDTFLSFYSCQLEMIQKLSGSAFE